MFADESAHGIKLRMIRELLFPREKNRDLLAFRGLGKNPRTPNPFLERPISTGPVLNVLEILSCKPGIPGRLKLFESRV